MRPAASSAGAGYADAYAELRAARLRRPRRADRAGAGRNRGRLRGGVGAPPGGERAAAAGRAAPRRPAAVLPRPRARRRLRRLEAGPGVREDDGRAGGRPERATERPPRHRGAARPSRRARSARRCGCPTRSIWWSPRSGGARTSARCSTRAATSSTTRTPPPGCRSSSATWATTGSPSRSRSCSSTSARTPPGSPTCSGSSRPSRCSRTPAPHGWSSSAATAAKLAYELELHGRRSRPRGDARALRRAARRRHPGRLAAGAWLPTSIRASTSPVTCAPGRSRPTGAAPCASASASAGTRSRRPASGCWGCGETASGCRPRSCSPRRSASELDFGPLVAELTAGG